MKKLSNDVTNTLDSNKTFTHLSTVVKELLENSIDAKAKNISVLICEGGISLIEVKDDGKGISQENMLLLGKRFSSTKLKSYSDLASINTFGFRGEALSILSYISTLIIISRTENSHFGYEASFRNGRLINEELKAVPCEIGTIIRIENIFYNNIVRKNSYDKTSEAEDIISLVSKFAFHFIKINFCLSTNNIMNKIFFTKNDLENNTELEIRKKLCVKLFKQQINDDLFKFDNEMKDINAINLNKKNIQFECYYTKPSATISKSKLILFVNNRLMQNSLLSKIFDQTYAKFLIKKGNYFAYLSITCPNEIIDFNVAANKSQVFFLKEDEMFSYFENILEEQLKEEINAKNFYMGSYGGFTKEKEESLLFSDKKNIYAKDKVRIDTNTVSIERYLTVKQIQHNSTIKDTREDDMMDDLYGNCDVKQREKELSKQLNGDREVIQLIYETLYNKSTELNEIGTEIIKKHFYVGYEKQNTAIFLQYNTSLFIFNLKPLLEEYFLYSLLSNKEDSISQTQSIKLKSTFTVEDLFNFISLHFPKKNSIIKSLRNNIEQIRLFTTEHLSLLLGNIMEINDQSQIQRIKVINLFNTKSFIANFIVYIPMLYYSIIEAKFHSKTESISYHEMLNQQNTNLNFIIESHKIYSYYLATAYMEYLDKEDKEFSNRFIRDIILFDMKGSSFFIRKNLKEDLLYEKIIDTETLYTVFERC